MSKRPNETIMQWPASKHQRFVDLTEDSDDESPLRPLLLQLPSSRSARPFIEEEIDIKSESEMKPEPQSDADIGRNNTQRHVIVEEGSNNSSSIIITNSDSEEENENDDAKSDSEDDVPVDTEPPATDPTTNTFAEDPELLEIAKEIYALAMRRENVCITGPAGSGKSWVIRTLTEWLRQAEKTVQIIAPTGTAALNVGGRTCHSFMGLTPNTVKRPLSEVVKVAHGPTVLSRLNEIDVLIIDEISMVSNGFLTQMDHIMQEAWVKGKALKKQKSKKDAKRKQQLEFGGVTVIVVGDFAQLPPVRSQESCIECGELRVEKRQGRTWSCNRCGDDVHDEQKWAFSAKVWQKLQFRYKLLDKILRQNNPDFQDIVRNLFLGNKLQNYQLDLLRAQTNVIGQATTLYSCRESAARHNETEYRQLETKENHYICVDDCYITPAHKRSFVQYMTARDTGSNTLTLLKDHRYDRRVKLRIGMPVVLLTNLSIATGLVNGSQGKVVGWFYRSAAELSRISDGIQTSGFVQDVDLGRLAINYVPTLTDGHESRRHNRICAFAGSYDNAGKPWPVVEFEGGRRVVIYADCSVQEIAHAGAVSLFMRTQIPLLPAWALTIHKSQGMTLQKVVINLRDAFVAGQEYVALSRAASLEGLEIRGLGAALGFRVPHEVRRFMKDHYPELGAEMRE